MTIRLHAVQLAYRQSQAAYRAFIGGRGAGKSWIGTYDLARKAKPRRLYLVAAPTYPMLQDATLRAFLEITRAMRYLLDWRKASQTAILGNGAEILFRSADDPERLRGPNLSGLLLDEAGQIERAAFDIGIACLREGGEQGWCAITTTPRGRANWTYDVFGKRQQPGVVELFRARTQDNPFNPAGFAEGLRGRYTWAFARQEIDAEFTDPLGTLAKREWFPILPTAPVCRRHCRGWDFAATARDLKDSNDPDFTAGVLWGDMGGGRWCILHIVRGQIAAGSVEIVLKQTAESDRAKYGACQVELETEPGSSGKMNSGRLIQMLAGHNVHAAPATGDKVQRWMPFLAQAEAGNVCLAPGDWNQTFLDEITTAPESPHDDQADAAAVAFNRFALGTGSRVLY